jgi:thiol-disulfide isomerase/thioredoxin
MRSRLISLAIVLIGVAPFTAAAQDLTVGSAAPPITVSRWIKGEPVDRLEPGKTYVVEFWATWCGPCRTSIPHLTELQKKFEDRGVTFIGVSAFESDQKKVEPFVKEMGDKMEYTVALDDVPDGERGPKGKMAQAWMQAADEHGIPTAFIVNDEKIAWIGHPMSIDEPLEKVVAGAWDLDVAARERREAKDRQRKITAALTRINQALRSGETQEALAAIDEAIAENPMLESSFGPRKFQLLRDAGREDEASAYGDRLVETALKGNPFALNFIAWQIVDPASKRAASQSDLKLALKAAERANELTHGENGMILDTLAKVYFDSGDPAKALKLQEKAVKLAGRENQEMKDRLEQYRKAVEEKDR